MAGSGKNNANKSRGKKKESVPVRNPKKGRVFYPWISNFANVTIGQSTCAT